MTTTTSYGAARNDPSGENPSTSAPRPGQRQTPAPASRAKQPRATRRRKGVYPRATAADRTQPAICTTTANPLLDTLFGGSLYESFAGLAPRFEFPWTRTIETAVTSLMPAASQLTGISSQIAAVTSIGDAFTSAPPTFAEIAAGFSSADSLSAPAAARWIDPLPKINDFLVDVLPASRLFATDLRDLILDSDAFAATKAMQAAGLPSSLLGDAYTIAASLPTALPELFELPGINDLIGIDGGSAHGVAAAYAETVPDWSEMIRRSLPALNDLLPALTELALRTAHTIEDEATAEVLEFVGDVRRVRRRMHTDGPPAIERFLRRWGLLPDGFTRAQAEERAGAAAVAILEIDDVADFHPTERVDDLRKQLRNAIRVHDDKPIIGGRQIQRSKLVSSDDLPTTEHADTRGKTTARWNPRQPVDEQVLNRLEVQQHPLIVSTLKRLPPQGRQVLAARGFTANWPEAAEVAGAQPALAERIRRTLAREAEELRRRHGPTAAQPWNTDG